MRAYCDKCKKETIVEPRKVGRIILYMILLAPIIFFIPLVLLFMLPFLRDKNLYCAECGAMIPTNSDNQPVPRCPKCHVFVEESDAFCPKCGANIKHLKTCTKCKTVNKKNAKYCINCGNGLK